MRQGTAHLARTEHILHDFSFQTEAEKVQSLYEGLKMIPTNVEGKPIKLLYSQDTIMNYISTLNISTYAFIVLTVHVLFKELIVV